MRVDERRRDKCHRSGGARDHRRTAAGEGNDDADHERCEEPDLGVNAGYEG